MRVKTLVPYAVLVLALAGASACDDGSTPSEPVAPSPAAQSAGASTGASTGASSDSVRTIEVSISGRTVTPAPAQVDLAIGESLRLVVTSDRANELHAHGFEAEAALGAGTPTTVTLVGKEAGVFEVETHDPALTLLTVAVR